MNRSLAFIATGLCAAPLLVIAGMTLTHSLTRPGGGSDQTIAQGYATVLGGIALAIVGGALIWYLTRHFVPENRVGYLLAIDVVVLVIGLVTWQRTFSETPRLESAEGTPLLQVELRIPQDVLAGDQVDAVVAIDFAGGDDASVPHPELARVEGNAVILPWETTPIRVNAWQIRVMVRDAEMMFDLPFARAPDPSTVWSGWIGPASDGPRNPEGVTLRYRYQVIARGS